MYKRPLRELRPRVKILIDQFDELTIKKKHQINCSQNLSSLIDTILFMLKTNHISSNKSFLIYLFFILFLLLFSRNEFVFISLFTYFLFLLIYFYFLFFDFYIYFSVQSLVEKNLHFLFTIWN